MWSCSANGLGRQPNVTLGEHGDGWLVGQMAVFDGFHTRVEGPLDSRHFIDMGSDVGAHPHQLYL